MPQNPASKIAGRLISEQRFDLLFKFFLLCETQVLFDDAPCSMHTAPIVETAAMAFRIFIWSSPMARANHLPLATVPDVHCARPTRPAPTCLPPSSARPA